MDLSSLIYGVYERRLAHDLDRTATPRHVGVMLDGNRRWAKARGADTADGTPRRCRQHRDTARLV
jgi:short-chain Z-isoprenyl diphosphate synthase